MAWKTIGLAVATGTLVALVGSLVTKPLLREFGPRSFALEPLAGLPS